MIDDWDFLDLVTDRYGRKTPGTPQWAYETANYLTPNASMRLSQYAFEGQSARVAAVCKHPTTLNLAMGQAIFGIGEMYIAEAAETVPRFFLGMTDIDNIALELALTYKQLAWCSYRVTWQPGHDMQNNYRLVVTEETWEGDHWQLRQKNYYDPNLLLGEGRFGIGFYGRRYPLTGAGFLTGIFDDIHIRGLQP